MTAKATPGSCIFCGRSGEMSKEHVWSDWIAELAPDDIRAHNFTYTYETSQHGEFRKVPGQPLFQKRVRAVCETCNSGWMSRREDAVKPYISGMLFGRGRHLHREGQIALATWGALKALVAQRSFREHDPYGRIPDEHYHELYELRDKPILPDSVAVYTAQTAWSRKQAYPGFYRLNGIALRGEEQERQDGYLLTFAVLDVMLQVLRLFDHPGARFGHRPGLAESVRRIYPPTDSFVWPPGPALTQGGVLAIAGDDA